MDLIERFRTVLRDRLAPELAEVALPGLRIELRPGRLVLVVANSAWEAVARSHLAGPAQESLAELAPDRQVEIRLGDGVAVREERTGATFASLIEDPGNALALAACRRIVESPGLEHNPLLLHGPAGCGKSHLVEAVVGEFRGMLGPTAAVVLSGDELVRRAHDLAQRRNDGLRGEIAGAALLVIDGLDSLRGRDLAQEELFSLINAALERGQQLLLTARQPPRADQGFTDRLASRLAWGLVADVDAPLIETRLALVRRILGPRGETFSPTALAEAVERRAPDMHQALILAERLQRGPATLEADRATEVGFDRIVQLTAERFGLRPGDLTGQRRLAEVVQARGVALLLARRLTGHSLYALGGMVGGRDHATVLHALRTTEARIAEDPALKQVVQELTQALLG